MAKIVCLANSDRPGGRCIAGIDIDTGRWVRPVSRLEHMAITKSMRMVNGREPALLEVLDIPLDDSGPDGGCQPENRHLKPGAWKKVGQWSPRNLRRFCEDPHTILHNHKDRVPPEVFKTLPKAKWRSLQLVDMTYVTFGPDFYGKIRAFFEDGEGYPLQLPLKDPVLLERVLKGQRVCRHCILTVSMGTPWSHDDKAPRYCYKLAAGVVEL
jgi:hypothetical protein